MDFGTGCLFRKYGRETSFQWPAGSICPSHREILFEPCNLLTLRFPDVLLPQFTQKAHRRSFRTEHRLRLVAFTMSIASPQGQRARRPVHPEVLEVPLDGIHAVGKHSLHPFQVGQPGAVGVLVEYTGRHRFWRCAAGLLTFLAGRTCCCLGRLIRHHTLHSP